MHTDITWHGRPARGRHAQFARETFGLDAIGAKPPEPCKLPLPQAGECIAVVGPSGAGKTLALRALNATEVSPLRCEELNTPVLELFDARLPSESVLRSLARVGLADGRLWALRAGQLSAGECRRLEFALALCGREGVLVADEFDAHLDSTTACVLAQNLRRLVERDALQLVVSTHRPETLAYLQPRRVIEIDGGIATERGDLPGAARTMLDEIEIAPGRLRDYDRFKHWHYLGPGRPGPTSDVLLATHRGRAVGIVTFGYPHLLLSIRAEALPQFAPRCIAGGGAGALNRDLRLLQRVVVEPRFRGVGIAQALIRAGLERLQVPYVECIAQMGGFSDFLLASGFRQVGEVAPPRSARKLAGFLAERGITPDELLEPERRAAVRERLAGDDREQLDGMLRGLANTRIQTGFGSLRDGHGGIPETLLRKALARLHARPGYFLWTRSGRET